MREARKERVVDREEVAIRVELETRDESFGKARCKRVLTLGVVVVAGV